MTEKQAMAATFAEDGIGWQIQQLQQRVSEWAEFQLLNDPPDIPLGSLPTIPGWVIRALLWLVLTLALAWLLWVAAQIGLPMAREWLMRSPILPQSHPRPAQSPGAAVWLKRSRHWQQEGNYRQACRALYMAMLEHLDEAQQVPRSSSRTDGQYGDCIASLPQSDAYRVLLGVHEQLCFGNADISVEVFQRCQRAYQTIEQTLTSRSAGQRL